MTVQQPSIYTTEEVGLSPISIVHSTDAIDMELVSTRESANAFTNLICLQANATLFALLEQTAAIVHPLGGHGPHHTFRNASNGHVSGTSNRT